MRELSSCLYLCMKTIQILIAFAAVFWLSALQAQSINTPVDNWQFHFEDVVDDPSRSFNSICNQADVFRGHSLGNYRKEIKVNGTPEYKYSGDSTRTDYYHIKIEQLPSNSKQQQGIDFRFVQYDLIFILKAGRWKYIATNFQYMGTISGLGRNLNLSNIKPSDADARNVKALRRLCYDHAQHIIGELMKDMKSNAVSKSQSEF